MNRKNASSLPDLSLYFQQINGKFFDGMLDDLELVWNPRLSSVSGRFFPRRQRGGYFREPRIELATFVLDTPDWEAQIMDILGHEMIHYWLWFREQPYGHTPEFLAKMQEMGVSRFHKGNPNRTPRYVYTCPNCGRQTAVQRVLRGNVACQACCLREGPGRYDSRFKLVRKRI